MFVKLLSLFSASSRENLRHKHTSLVSKNLSPFGLKLAEKCLNKVVLCVVGGHFATLWRPKYVCVRLSFTYFDFDQRKITVGSVCITPKMINFLKSCLSVVGVIVRILWGSILGTTMNVNENLCVHFWDTIIQCPQAFLGPTRLKCCGDIKGGLNMPHTDTFCMGWP